MAPVSYDIVPGKAVGPLLLNASLFETISFLSCNRNAFPEMDLSYGVEAYLDQPFVIKLHPNGLSLRFDPASQQLVEISVQAPADDTVFLNEFSYNGQAILAPFLPFSLPHALSLFGPTYPGAVDAQGLYSVRYPGLVLHFTIPAGVSGSDLDAVTLGATANPLLLDSLSIISDPQPCDVEVDFSRSAVTKGSETVRIGDSSQQIIACFGPLGVQGVFIPQITPTLSTPDPGSYYYLNYFPQGISFKLDAHTHRIVAIILHTNLPHSEFCRFARCCFSSPQGFSHTARVPDFDGALGGRLEQEPIVSYSEDKPTYWHFWGRFGLGATRDGQIFRVVLR